MSEWTTIVVSVFVAVMASSGFWAYVAARRVKKDNGKDMLIGLGHDRLIHLGMVYIEQGYITEDEYDNYVNWLYKPYEAIGGNGSVKRIKVEIDKLPIKKSWTAPHKKENAS